MSAGASDPTGDGSVTWRRDGDLPFQRMDEDAIVVNPKTREVHLLNETAARIWELLERPRSIDDLVQSLAQEYEGAPGGELLRQVHAFVAEMSGKGLIETAPSRGRA